MEKETRSREANDIKRWCKEEKISNENSLGGNQMEKRRQVSRWGEEGDLLELVLVRLFSFPLLSFHPLFVSSVDGNFQYGTKSSGDGNAGPSSSPCYCTERIQQTRK